MGGLFSIFHKKSALKAPKTCDFAFFTNQWGGSSPPTPGYATECDKVSLPICESFFETKPSKKILNLNALLTRFDLMRQEQIKSFHYTHCITPKRVTGRRNGGAYLSPRRVVCRAGLFGFGPIVDKVSGLRCAFCLRRTKI